MKDFLIFFFFLCYYARVSGEECHEYSYSQEKSSNCVTNFIVSPCEDKTFCPFKFGNKTIPCKTVNETQNEINYDNQNNSIDDNKVLFP